MEKLKLKPTLEAALILLGFFVVLLAATLLLPTEEGEATRVVILEWGAFPLLCAIVGGVIAQKSGFLPLYGLLSGIVFLPFLLFCFAEKNFYVILAYIVFGYVGTLLGTYLYCKEVRRIENGEKEEHKKPLLLRLFDRHDLDQYK